MTDRRVPDRWAPDRWVPDRWVPDPAPRDGPEGRGESGAGDDLVSRRLTEEAAWTGRFPDGGEVRDDSNPIEPEEERPA